MNKIISFLAFLFFSLISISVVSQNKPEGLDNVQISILTCGVGDDLYTLFGHTALRVKDETRDYDIVYNWGTFDFGENNMLGRVSFGINFLRGKLPYKLGVTRLEPFLREYQYYKRSVDEQVLRLTNEGKISILDFLKVNLKKENIYYKYNFYFDNCTTRIRDIVEDEYSNLQYPQINKEKFTFRDLLHQNLSHHPWTKFGMDIILGPESDQVATAREQMFLPAYLEAYIDESTANNEDVITKRNNILHFDKSPSKYSWVTPMSVFVILLILEVIGFFLFYISGDLGFLLWFDSLWFVGLSFAFIFFTLMWIGTDHTVCANNWNLIWASPVALLFFFKDQKIRNIGFSLTIILSVITLLGWKFIPQAFPLTIVLIMLINIIKSSRLLGLVKWIDKRRRLPSVAVVFFIALLHLQGQGNIRGVTMVSTAQPSTTDIMGELRRVNANWVALVPFGFSKRGQPQVRYGSNRQWWGERVEGIINSVKLAKAKGLSVMIKPQVWIPGGWVGEMDFDNESDWKIWEDSYRAYVMTFLDIATEHDVALFCLGTEYRVSVVKREEFWRTLIKDIRKKYNGKLIYSANWDSYDRVPFWDALDYIGISAYFPLSDMDTPPTMLLSYRWRKYVAKLEKLSEKHNKKIVFTEYGYLSVDGAAGKTWELEKEVKTLDINEQAQANSYNALFKAFWYEKFWAGGFLWKWFPEGKGHEGYPERDYTPQNKKAQVVLKEWYGK